MPIQTQESEKRRSNESSFWQQIGISLLAGGLAGAASRTAVSPLERLKIIQQVQPKDAQHAYKGVIPSLRRIWNEEGFAGMMRGNGSNCVRIVPYIAAQFMAYEVAKNALAKPDGSLDSKRMLLAGSAAGTFSVLVTYPLDLIRSRISVSTAKFQVQNGCLPQNQLEIWEGLRNIYKNEGGIRALYKGCIATAIGVAPYVGINFTVYEKCRVIVGPENCHPISNLIMGGFSGLVAQSLTYPFDYIRRKLQVVGMNSKAFRAEGTNAFQIISSTVSRQGISGLYVGMAANMLKVVPSMGVTFCKKHGSMVYVLS